MRRTLSSQARSHMKPKRFPKSVVEAIDVAKILGIRAGTKPHRVIGIWVVVAEGRVFVRSYSLKERSWYRTFLEEPRGIIEVNGKQMKVSAHFAGKSIKCPNCGGTVKVPE